MSFIKLTIITVALAIKAAITNTTAPIIPLILLALVLGLPGVLIIITAHSLTYVGWMLIYLLSLPIWNFVLPVYAFWHFDDFSWGDTRQAAGDTKGSDKGGHGGQGEFDSSKITMKRWGDFEQERRLRAPRWESSAQYGSDSPHHPASVHYGHGQMGQERRVSSLMI
jgi:chitin synthase